MAMAPRQSGRSRKLEPSTTFETFPFPKTMTPVDAATGAPTGPLAEAIVSAARRLNGLRKNGVYPPEWVQLKAELNKRTLINHYNQRATDGMTAPPKCLTTRIHARCWR